MSSFKMHTTIKNEVIPNTINERIDLVKTEHQVHILTNFVDDFGEDKTINIDGEKIIVQANTSKLHYS